MNSKKVVGISILGLIILIIVGIFLFGGNKEVYKVTFVNDDSKEVVEVKKNDTVARPVDPTKSGYEFKGWYKEDTEFDFTSKITENITLTAKWEKVSDSEKKEETKVKSYTVEFYTDGGSAISELIVKEGRKVTKPVDPIKEGYIFIGWYYNDTLYDFNSKVTKHIILTAKWEKLDVITHTIEKTESKVGQVILFVLKNDVKVDGIVDITLTNGTTITNVEIPKDGYITNGYRIKTISNVKENVK